MGLSGDQKALLRLLAQREQGYEDIASLMGLSVEEVRARVKDALDAVEREGGEVPPAPEAPAEESPEAPRAEEKPPKPPASAAEAPDFPPPVRPAARPTRATMPKERRVYAIAGGLGLIVIVIVLLATGTIGGGDSGSDSGSSGDTSGETSQNASNGQNTTAGALADSKLTGAILEPVDGGDAEGAALFGKAKKQILLQVEAAGLEPSPQGSTYTIWFYKSPELALRVGAVEVSESGGLRVQLPVPEELLRTIAGGVFDKITISLTSTAEYRAEVARAKKADDIPAYTGETVLSGELQGPLTKAPSEGG